MIKLLEQLNELGWFSSLLIVAIFIVLVPAVIDSWKKFKSSLGLKNVDEIEDENVKNTLSNLQNQINNLKDYHNKDMHQHSGIQEEIMKAISNINKALDDIKSDALETKIDNMRWKILDFSSQLRNGQITHPEQFSNVLKTYDDYEVILKKHGLTNGQIDGSILFIREKYHEMLANDE